MSTSASSRATGRCGRTPSWCSGRDAPRHDAAPSVRPYLTADHPSIVARLGWRGLIWLAAYAVALGACHYFVIAAPFGYFGYEDVPPNMLFFALTLPSYLLCARRLPASWERPSAIAYWMLFLFVVAPVHVLPAFITTPTMPVWLMVGSVAAAFWLLGGIYSVPLLRIPRPVIAPRHYWRWFVIGWLLLIGVVVYYYGLRFQIVSMSDIYDVRDSYRESFAEVPRLARYPVTWLGNVVAPLAIARGLTTRRWLWALLGVATELYLVSLTGFKQMMFAALLVAGVVILVRTTDLRRVGYRVAALTTTGVIAVTTYDIVDGGYSVSSVLVRRLILTTAIQTKYHFEFFSDHPKAHLGYGLLARWVDYPYHLTPPFLLGEVYYGRPEMSANANLWADAYANFGLVGVFTFTGILALALLLFDSVTVNLPAAISIAALAQSAFSLSNTAMLTVFLTHGLILAALVVSFMPADAPNGVRTVPADRTRADRTRADRGTSGDGTTRPP